MREHPARLPASLFQGAQTSRAASRTRSPTASCRESASRGVTKSPTRAASGGIDDRLARDLAQPLEDRPAQAKPVPAATQPPATHRRQVRHDGEAQAGGDTLRDRHLDRGAGAAFAQRAPRRRGALEGIADAIGISRRRDHDDQGGLACRVEDDRLLDVIRDQATAAPEARPGLCLPRGISGSTADSISGGSFIDDEKDAPM